jgi:hypothetical protein
VLSALLGMAVYFIDLGVEGIELLRNILPLVARFSVFSACDE